jgi:heme A synthase
MPTVSQRISDFYRDARRRAQRRKSAWNILLVPLCFGGFLGCWYVLFRLVWKFHTAIYPEHHFAEFWRPGISMANFILSFLMMFSITPAAVALGFMLGNILIWLIPPARRVLDAEAEGYPGTSFVESMRGLFKISLWTIPIGFAVALTAAYLLNSLR